MQIGNNLDDEYFRPEDVKPSIADLQNVLDSYLTRNSKNVKKLAQEENSLDSVPNQKIIKKRKRRLRRKVSKTEWDEKISRKTLTFQCKYCKHFFRCNMLVNNLRCI